MGQPVNNEKVGSGDSVGRTEEPVTRSYLLGDVHTLPVDVESDDYNTMPEVHPESWLQRYWRQDGFLDESRAIDKTVRDVSAEGELCANKSSVQMADNSHQSMPTKRGCGRPRKQICPAPSMSTEHDHTAKAIMAARAIHSTIQTGERMNSAVSNHGRGVVMQPTTEPLPKYCPRGSRFSHRLARQHTMALKTTLAHITPAERGQPASHGDHLPRKHLKNMKADKVLPAVGDVNVPQKRGRPRKQLEVEVPCAELCGTCYNQVATLLDRDLNSNILPLRVGSRKLAEDKGVAKRSRGRPRTVKESHFAAFRRKDPIAGL